MFDKIKGCLWKVGAAVIAVLGFFLFFERGKRKDAEAKVENAEYEKNDAVLAEKQSALEAKREEIKTEAEAEKAKTLTPTEMVDFFKKKL
jgi:hypothetical protein